MTVSTLIFLSDILFSSFKLKSMCILKDYFYFDISLGYCIQQFQTF